MKPLSGVVGAEIFGADLSLPMWMTSSSPRSATAFHAHGVIFFRDQELTPEQHIAFARRWGDINVNRFFQPGRRLSAHRRGAEGAAPRKQHRGRLAHRPFLRSRTGARLDPLCARGARDRRGDTLFASMGAAFDALSERTQGHASGHERGALQPAPCSDREVYGADYAGRLGRQSAATQDAVHPVVIRHPVDAARVPLRQPRLHGTLRGLDQGGVGSTPPIPVPARLPPGIHLPLPLATRFSRVLGQLRDLALRPQRLSGPAALHAPHHRRRHPARPLSYAAGASAARHLEPDGRRVAGARSPVSIWTGLVKLAPRHFKSP